MTDKLSQEKKYSVALRKAEKVLSENFKLLSKIPQINPENLREVLDSILPNGLAPKNIGELSEVIWPFQYDFEFDLATNPATGDVIIPANLDLEDRFQVSAEAGFILFNITRSFETVDIGGFEAPLTCIIQDPQASKYFMSKHIPISHIGVRSDPTTFAVPHYIPSNSNLQCNLGSFLNADIEVTGLKSSKHTITLTGVRIRSDLASIILEAMKLK